MKSRSRLLLHLALAVAAVAASLAVIEIGVRVVTAFDRSYLDEIVHRQAHKDGTALKLADLLRVNSDDLIVYDLRPGVRGTFLGHEVSINSLGFRERERNPSKPRGTFRILGLGDSHMFGWGVGEDETFLAILERRLKERHPGHAFEVWNLAVPGYNTVQEVETFARKADELEPDLVIINFVDNDMDLPNFLAERPNPWSLRKSFLKELLYRRRAEMGGKPQWPIGLIGLSPDETSGRYLFDPARFPERYRPLAGWDHMVGGFDRLAALAKARGIRPVLLINIDNYGNRLAGRTPDINPGEVRELAKHCAAEGYLVVDPQDRVTEYLERNRLDTTAVWLSPTDSHTNPLRHRLLAEELAQRLEEARLIPAS
jgi:GDSL-like lipase/acylhydrolase family protein